jgi:lipase maturation factor 1
MNRLAHAARWLFDSEHGAADRLIPRWLFLRVLGGIYFSAFFSLVFQIRGLIGPQGILPANEYLQAVARTLATAAACGSRPRSFGSPAAHIF